MSAPENPSAVHEQISTVLSRILRVPAADIDENTSPDTARSWDSITHFRLIAALEEQFGLRFELREIQTMDSFRGIAGVLEARASAQVSPEHQA